MNNPSNSLVPLIISVVIVIGWVVMWAIGLFQSLGPLISGAVIGGELLMLVLIWVLWLRGKLPPLG